MPSEKRARQRALRDQKRAVEQRQRKRSRTFRRVGGAVIVVGLVIGAIALFSRHSPPKKTATTTTSSSTTTTVAAAVAPVCPPASGSTTRVVSFTKYPPICISATGVYDASVETDAGTFVFRMHAAASLKAVNNFVFLARHKFYDSTTFFRVIPEFVVQGGDPTNTGSGGPGYTWTGNTPPASCATNCYALGAVAMANTGEPTSNGSQFFIVVGPSGDNLPPHYTDFGQVISGMSVVQKIAADGNANASANGEPPKVLHHIVKVTISQVA